MLSSKSLLLLDYLRKNSREKLTTISKKTNIPISTLFDLLKELQDNLITKNTVLLNFSQLGYHTQAQVFLKVPQEQKQKLSKHLELSPHINSLYKLNNEWDFLLETIHHNIKDLDNFLEKLKQKFTIHKQKIHYLVDELKREGFHLT